MKRNFCLLPSAFCFRGSRRAISLLEVLISIGIIAIGILSVASLLPVGSIQAQRAEIEQRKISLGQNAANEVIARGLGNALDLSTLPPAATAATWSVPQLLYNTATCPWLMYDRSPFLRVVTGQWRVGDRPCFPGAPSPPFGPYAIDPLMCAWATTGGKADPAIQTFPAYAPLPASATVTPTIPYMARLTLRDACARASMGPTGILYTESRPLAEALCMARDDVVIGRPDDASLPAENQFSTDPTNKPLQRSSDGAFSWAATLTPNDPLTANTPPAPGKSYTLSTMIFYRRQPLVPTTGSGQEAMVQVTQITNPLFGGGDVTLTVVSSDPDAEAKLAIARPGGWLMLSRIERFSGASTWPVFKWYRIVSADDTEIVGSDVHRTLTLAGPDWQADTAFVPPPNPVTYACLFDGIVAVYQQTITLENPSSSWSP